MWPCVVLKNNQSIKQTNKQEPSLNQGSSRDGDHKYNLQSSLVCQNLVCLPLPTRSMQHQWQLMISCFSLTPCLVSRHLFANSCYISCLSLLRICCYVEDGPSWLGLGWAVWCCWRPKSSDSWILVVYLPDRVLKVTALPLRIHLFDKALWFCA